MSNVFNINPHDDDNEDISTRINMDELYEQKQKKDLAKLTVYKKVLSRVHQKIKTTNRMTNNSDNFCWYVVPEMLLGVPHYDQSGCIYYLVQQLEDNGFKVRYNHPNVLFISWAHWVPAHVRAEIKKKTGVEVDGYGNVVKSKIKNKMDIVPFNQIYHVHRRHRRHRRHHIPHSHLLLRKIKRKYKDISTYKPTGRFIFDDIFK